MQFVNKLSLGTLLTIAGSLLVAGFAWGFAVQSNLSILNTKTASMEKEIDAKADKEDVLDMKTDLRDIKNFLINRKGKN